MSSNAAAARAPLAPRGWTASEAWNGLPRSGESLRASLSAPTVEKARPRREALVSASRVCRYASKARVESPATRRVRASTSHATSAAAESRRIHGSNSRRAPRHRCRTSTPRRPGQSSPPAPDDSSPAASMASKLTPIGRPEPRTWPPVSASGATALLLSPVSRNRAKLSAAASQRSAASSPRPQQRRPSPPSSSSSQSTPSRPSTTPGQFFQPASARARRRGLRRIGAVAPLAPRPQQATRVPVAASGQLGPGRVQDRIGRGGTEGVGRPRSKGGAPRLRSREVLQACGPEEPAPEEGEEKK